MGRRSPVFGCGSAALRGGRALLPDVIEIALCTLVVGTLSSQPLRDGAAIALLGALIARRASGEASLPRRWALTVVLFVVANLVSALASADPRGALEALRFYPLGVLVFLGAREVVYDGAERRLFALVLAIVSFLGIDAIGQAIGGDFWIHDRQRVWGRVAGALPFPSDASLLPMLLPLGLAALPQDRPMALALRAAAITIVTAAVSLSGTRSAWCALVLLAGAFAVESGRARAAAGLVAIVLATSLATAALAPESAPGRLLSARAYHAEKRWPQWAAAWQLAREAPLLGHGPHSFHREVERRQGEGAVFAGVDLRYAPYPHDIYLEALAGTGALGLLALCALLGLGGMAALRAVRPSASGRAALLALSVFAGVGLFDLSLVKDWVQLCFWLPLGVAAGLDGDPEPATSGGAEESADRPPPR